MIKSNKSCTGCGVCSLKCPQGAIKMSTDSEGFTTPIIDNKLCINCNICEKLCPVINPRYENCSSPMCYAGASNDVIRYSSSSGGIFSELAFYVLENNGFVCGAAFKQDGSCEHIIIDKKSEIHKVQGSKYLQSDIYKILPEIKELLVKHKMVLFCGTPCQIAGLKNYLDNKTYEGLFLVDIVCHGVGSPKVFKKYLSELITDGSEFITTNFRDKVNGWTSKLVITTSTNRTTYQSTSEKDTYLRAFLNNLCLRNSCDDCKFNKLPRQGDLTLGDFWGVNKINKKLNDKKGLSEILVNNSKGAFLISKMQNKLKQFTSIELQEILPYNPTLNGSSKMHGNRDLFFKNLSNKNLKDNVDSCLKYDYLCLNFWTSLNYGAILTAYAFQSVLDSMNYSNAHIDYRYKHVRNNFKDSFTDNFARKYLHTTHQCKNFKDFTKLNAITTHGFIVGSDQVFRDDYIRKTRDFYLLSFAEPNKQRIAIAASFGKDSFILKNFKNSLKAFDAISVREDSGLSLCQKYNCSAQHILDPVFLAQTTIFEDLCKGLDCGKNLTVGYILDETEKTRKLVKKYGENFINIADKNISVEEFVAYIKNSKIFITDSFHGTCFALIFNKPFYTIYNSERGNARFESLFRTFKISNDNLNITDWNNINQIIEKERTKGINWLKNALSCRKNAFELKQKTFKSSKLKYKLKTFFKKLIKLKF